MKKTIKKPTRFVWDKCVRITHWLIAGGILGNLFFNHAGGDVHRYLGYSVLGLIAVRLLWAATFAKHPARLKDLVPTYSSARQHLKDLKMRTHTAEAGHNAFGLLAIWVMWLCVAGLAFTGYHEYAVSDLAIEYPLGDIHKVLAWTLCGLVVLHIVAVIFTSLRMRYDLVRPMIHR